jgi:hypothetical protein
LSVTSTSGPKPCFLSCLRTSFTVASLSRRRCTSRSRTSPSSSTARHSQNCRPAIITATSSRCLWDVGRGRRRRTLRFCGLLAAVRDKLAEIRRDANGSDILASFDTLEDAVRNVRRRRSDWRDVIHDGRKIVWPRAEPRLSRLLPGERGGYNEFAIPCL